MTTSFLDFSALTLRYRPFPIGLARPIMEDGLYSQFVDGFPSPDRFDDYAYLGNPGAKYTRNRHNVGFVAVERIAGRYRFSP